MSSGGILSLVVVMWRVVGGGVDIREVARES